MTSLTPLALTLLLTALIYKYILHPSLLSPLSKIPNAHWSSPFTSFWIDRRRRQWLENRSIHAAHTRLGPVVRLGPNELSFNSLDALKKIYTSGAFEKHEWYRDAFVNFRLDNMVGMLDRETHGMQKRLLSKVFSKSYLLESRDWEGFAGVILGERLLPLLDGAAAAREKEKRSVNVFPVMEAVGMDFISAYLFGLRRGTKYLCDAVGWERWLKSYEAYKYQTPEQRKGSFLETWCLEILDKMEQEQSVPDTTDTNTSDTNSIVYTTLSNGLEKNNDPRPRRLAIASEILDHLIAGHETSGITFTYAMWELSQRPALQDALRSELLTLSPTLHFHHDPNTKPLSLPSPSSIDTLPLLDAILRETLRLHAATPGPLPRVTPAGTSTVIEGYVIPPGVKVSSSAHTVHRHKDVFPEPEAWMPERWMDVEAEADGKVHDMRRMFWAFGSGGRMCLGSNFAMQGECFTTSFFGRLVR